MFDSVAIVVRGAEQRNKYESGMAPVGKPANPAKRAAHVAAA